MTPSTMADPQDLLALAAKVEAADAAESREWLEQAFYAANPAPECATPERVAWAPLSNRFHVLVMAGAFLDAAVTLVPEGWSWNAWGTGYARAIHPYAIREDREGRALTAALALTAAALRARAAIREGESADA